LKFLLDTNVLSEVRKGVRAHASVQEWWSTADERDIHTSVMVLGEIRQGVERLRLKNPQRATEIENWLKSLTDTMGPRLLVVNQSIADVWGRMGLKRTLPLVDSILAATALVYGLTLVTRNTKDIQDTGVSYLNPFEKKGPDTI
jgi:predicted nucleic acid-binding protein